MGDAVLQAHAGKGGSQPQTLPWCTEVLIQSLPALPQGPLVGHGSYRVKPNCGSKADVGAGCPCHCLNRGNHPEDLYS